MNGAVRMVQRNALVYRHVWSGSVFTSLVALFLGLALFNGVKPLP